MMIEYLNECMQELLAKRIDLQEALQKNEGELRENRELIHAIELSEDKSYESFAPRNYTSNRNEKKVKELKSDQQQLLENDRSLKKELEKINEKVERLESVIRAEKEKKNQKDAETRKKEINDRIYGLAVQQLTGVVNKMEICGKLMDVDRDRCKVELKNLSGIVRGVIDELNKYQM